MLQRKSIIEFGVIGLGRFGFALASALAKEEKEVIVLDGNENKIKQIRNYTDNAFVVESLDKDTLEEAGIRNCETVIVCIGENVEASILTTLSVIELGVPRVIAKAISIEHGKVLEKIGAEVIFPEHDMAIRLADRLISSKVLDYIMLDNDMSISELKITSKISNKTVLDINIRNRFNLNIIAIEKESVTSIDITPDLILEEGDLIVVVGNVEDVRKFENYLYK